MKRTLPIFVLLAALVPAGAWAQALADTELALQLARTDWCKAKG